MQLKRAVCPNCGCEDLGNIDFSKTTYKCPACDEFFIIEQAVNFAKVEVDKTKDIANYRKNLLQSVEKDKAEGIKSNAEKILDILPDDYVAGYFYAYANAKKGDSRYLYDFYQDFDKDYTEESCMRVADHIINHGELRDNGLIEKYLKNLKYSSEDYLSYYREVFSKKIKTEELYDDITRDVFICHRSTDIDVAKRIVKELEDDGNKCWISSRNLRPNDNDNYWDDIKRAIKSCRIFLVVSSRDAMLSTDVRKEIAHAKELNKKRLEIKIDESEHNAYFKDFFDGCKWIKGENYEEIKTRVADLLSKILSGAETDVIIHKVKKLNFAPIQEAKAVEKIIVDDLHEHNFKKVQVVPPTCDAQGYTLYRCECGEEKKTDFTPRRTEHDFREAERKLPTCTENGYVKYECVYCDQIKKEVLPATGHKYELFDKKVPTCINEGHDIYKCSVCGDTDVKTLPKTPHTYGDWKVAKQPTCIKEGEEVRQCSFCGKTETRPIPANGHSFSKWVVKTEPTCDKEGIEHRQCKTCGKIEERSLPKRNHKYSAWQNSKDGKYKERICEYCGFVEKQLTEEYTNKNKASVLEIVSYVLFGLAGISLLVGTIIFFLNCYDIEQLAYNSWKMLITFLVGVISWITAQDFKVKVKKLTKKAFIYKSMLWKVLSTTLIIILSCWSLASCVFIGLKPTDGYADGYYYNHSKSGSGIVLEYSREELTGDIVVPTTINGKTVVGIGDNAFKDCDSLTSIEIPNSVKSIGKSAFEGCTSLESVTIGNSVASIGEWAFSGCSNLTSIEIPGSVTSIGYSAFTGCNALIIYSEAESRPSGWDSLWNSSNAPVVWDCKNNDVAHNGYIYIFHDGIQYGIKDGVAEVVRQTSSIISATIETSILYKEIGYSVTRIGTAAFKQCSSLTSIEMPNSVTSIGSSAFYNCSSLTSVEIPNSVTSIGNSAFYGCTSLTSIEYNATECGSIGEDNNIFYNAGQHSTGITITIGASVKIIPAYLFSPCFTELNFPKIMKVVFDKGGCCERIGNHAFEYCSSLESIEIPNSVTSIGEWAFYDCTSLTSIEISNNITSIGRRAFSGCDSLARIIIPNSVTYMGWGVFYNSAIEIYCEAEIKPYSWDYDWNIADFYDRRHSVVWGYKGE